MSILPYVPFQENTLDYCMYEWMNEWMNEKNYLKKDIKLEGEFVKCGN